MIDINMSVCTLVDDSFSHTWAYHFTASFVGYMALSSIPFFYYYVNMTKEKWQYKTNPAYPKAQLVANEIVSATAYLVYNSLAVTVGAFLAATGGAHGLIQFHGYCFGSLSSPTWQYDLFQLVIFLPMFDSHSYICHYLEHTWRRWWNGHRHHHLFPNASPYGSVAGIFFDAHGMFLFFLFVLFPFFIPINLDLALIMFSSTAVFGAYHHSGHELSFISPHTTIFHSSYDHYVHHAHSYYGKVCNISALFIHWDNILGTRYKGTCKCVQCRPRRTEEEWAMTKKPDYTTLWKETDVWVEAFRHEILGYQRSEKRI